MSEKKKILLVEDDAAISLMYRGKFEADGYEVLTAENGVSGLESAKKENPNLVMLDIIVPQMDGFTVLSELKNDAKTKNIPIVMLTNLGTDDDKAKAEKMGAVDYIVKANLTPAEVSKKIKKYLK